MNNIQLNKQTKFKWRKTCRNTHSWSCMICVCNTYIHHTSWFFPIGYHLILSYRTTVQTYKHCQLANILPSHAGSWSGPGKNISSPRNTVGPPLFHSNKKPGWFFFFVRRYIVRNSIFQIQKKYAGQFWERANTSFHDLCAFFFKGVWGPISTGCQWGHFGDDKHLWSEVSRYSPLFLKFVPLWHVWTFKKTKNYIYIYIMYTVYIYTLYIYGISYKILYSSNVQEEYDYHLGNWSSLLSMTSQPPANQSRP